MDFEASRGTQEMSLLDQNVFAKRPIFMADLGRTFGKHFLGDRKSFV